MTTLPVRRPLATATRVTLFQREVIERLSAVGIDLLLSHALVLSEGQRSSSTTAGEAFFGSLMITVDLAQLATLVREPIDAAQAARIAAMLDGDQRFLARVAAISAREAERLSQGPAPLRSLETKLRVVGTVLHVDVEIEGQPAKASARR